ncbi:uncharacterized protein LOC110027246 [Phalaenopsis equestris]|uniref:uncharacterized protein LOC110027246 n=1 Tax=Phalaenopsis equestris TaxID=78828 RepID=UPI0009E5EB07|nr:uncharacterized protein LOC110027246 [Phalaenopsis equestris]
MYEAVDGAKAHEILARFRPIAPKPQPPPGQLSLSNTPALQLRSRRKRSRAHLPAKRHKTATNTLFPCLNASPPERNFLALSLHQPKGKPQPLVERDLLQKLQEPKIITPRPVRPVGSSISVGPINELVPSSAPPPPKRPAEVEDEVESEKLPAVVSDYKNRVRLANSAYKELVGQPECMWLDSMAYGSDCKGFAFRPLSRRINGEVMLEFSGDSAAPPPPSLNGFSCRVKIEWACNGRKSFVDAPCDVCRVYCESKEYLFTWKFHVGEAYRTDFVS